MFLFYRMLYIMAKRKSSVNYKLNLKKLCNPSMLYFVLSLVALVVMGIQNLNGSDDTFCLGQYECNLGNKMVVFLLNAVYILFWTFILDLMCKAGYSEISWFIVLIPFMLFFLFLGIIMYKSV